MADESRPPGWPFEGVNEDGTLDESIGGTNPPPIFEPPTAPAPPLDSGRPPTSYTPPPSGQPPTSYTPPPPGQPPTSYTPPPPGQPPTSYTPPPPGQPPAASYSPLPPGQPPPPPSTWVPPPPKKSGIGSVVKVILLLVAIVVVGIGGCTAWFVSTVKAPVDESNAFLALIDNQDYSGAAAFSDPSCNEGMSAAQLEQIFRGADISYNLNSSSITNSSARVSGSLTSADLPYDSIEVQLQKRTGDWGVCGFSLQ